MVIRAEIEEKHRQRVEMEVSGLTMNCGKTYLCPGDINTSHHHHTTPTRLTLRVLQVRKLREKISDLKVEVTSITKGIPISQWNLSSVSKERRKSDADISSTTSPDSSELTGSSSNL